MINWIETSILCEWSVINIHLGEDKTTPIMFTGRNKIKKTNILVIHHGDIQIKQHSKVTYLCCILDEDQACWNLVDKRTYYCMKRIKQNLNPSFSLIFENLNPSFSLIFENINPSFSLIFENLNPSFSLIFENLNPSFSLIFENLNPSFSLIFENLNPSFSLLKTWIQASPLYLKTWFQASPLF